MLHVGEKPYVVAAAGPVELSRQGLGLGAMEGMLAQLLTADALRSLREMGAVEHELADCPAAAGDRFTVVAARGGDDIWIEMRRHRRTAQAPAAVVVPEPEPAAVPAPSAPEPEPMAASGPVASAEAAPLVDAVEPEPALAETPAAVEATAEDVAPAASSDDDLTSPIAAETPRAEAEPVAPPMVESSVELSEPALAVAGVASEAEDLLPAMAEVTISFADMAAANLFAVDVEEVLVGNTDDRLDVTPDDRLEINTDDLFDELPEVIAAAEAPAPALAMAAEAPPSPVPAAPAPVASTPAAGSPAAPTPAPPSAPSTPAPAPAAAPASPADDMPDHDDSPLMPAAWATPASPRFDSHPHESIRYGEPAPQPGLPGLASEFDAMSRDQSAVDSLPAVVLSLTRDGARGTGSGARAASRPGGIERLLRLAAARGASTLYLTTQARPAVRVDGDIRLLDGESALSSGDVEAAVLELVPEGTRATDSAEWSRDVDEVGRVRVTTFRDYRGPGVLLRINEARTVSAEQIGLVREIQTLTNEPDGLIIVAGPRASGKSTLVSAFVDLITRQRNDHVITLEGRIRPVHDSRGSLVSQRELRGSAAQAVTAARAALDENPDVLVIEDLRSPDVLQVALDAAGSGLLVFASVTAASATAALERLVNLCPSEQRPNVRAALAEHLRGVVAQVLLRKTGGGRLAARELVLKTDLVTSLVGDGRLAELASAIDSGRKLGMAPLNDALVAFVQSGAVDVREAYRKADDKAGLLALLRREGIDTSFVERLA